MALIFCESFDHLSNDYLQSKWTAIYNFGTGGQGLVLNNVFQRTGIQCGGFTADGAMVTIENSVFWTFGAAINWAAYGGAVAFEHLGTVQVQLQINNDGTMSVYNGPHGLNPGVLLGTTDPSVAITLGRYYYIEFQSTISQNAGTATVRINGQVVLDLSGVNTSPNGDNIADSFQVFGPGGRSYMYVDDLYVTDGIGVLNSFLGDVSIGLIMPASPGDNSQWTPLTGSNWSEVNAVPPSGDAAYVWSVAPSSGSYPIDTYYFQQVNPNRSIIAIQTNILARKDDTGNRALSLVTRYGGANSLADSTGRYVNETYIDYRNCFDVNPLTTNPWTPTVVNATQWGYQLIR
jgi:hypothetical protein